MDSDIESHFSQSVLTNYKQKAFTLAHTQEIHADVCEKHPKETTNEVIFELSFVVLTWINDLFIWLFSIKFKELSVILKIISLYLICASLIFHSMSNLKKERKERVCDLGFCHVYLRSEIQLPVHANIDLFKVDSQDSDATRISSQETTQTEDRGYYSNFDSRCYLCAPNTQNTCLMKILWLI